MIYVCMTKYISHFSWNEMYSTNTGIENTPKDINVISNLVELARFLDGIRDELGLPIIVNSAYRNEAVNAKVGGVKSSHHCLGFAADIRCKDMDKLLDILNKHIKELDEFILYKTFFHISIAPLKRGKVIDARLK